jgi:hypothetical protein
LQLDNNGTNGSTNIEVVNNIFDNCGKAETSCTNTSGHTGLFSEPYTDDLLIERNIFRDTGRNTDPAVCDLLSEANNHMYRHDHHVYVKGKNIKIQNNIFLRSCCGVGIKIDGYLTGPEIVSPNYSHIVINNTFGPNISEQPYDMKSGHPTLTFNSTPSSFDPRWLIKNNIYLNPTRTSASPHSLQLLDTGSSNWAPDNFCENNVSTKNGVTLLSTCGDNFPNIAANVTENNNVENKSLTDMAFADEPSDDYHLTSGSAAIEAADCADSNAPSTDFDGHSRSSTNCDAGAYEF